MATKYVCDGCGHETSTKTQLSSMDISVEDNSGYGMDSTDHHYDLCASCLRTFLRSSLPNTWARAAAEKKQ